jgi:hypothetical protein
MGWYYKRVIEEKINTRNPVPFSKLPSSWWSRIPCREGYWTIDHMEVDWRDTGFHLHNQTHKSYFCLGR